MLPLKAENRRLLVNHNRSLRAVNPDLLRVLTDLAEGRSPWPLFIFGGCGTGKTSAALALADIVETASYHTADGLASFVMNRGGDEAEAEFDRIGGKHLAVLDELGARLNVGDLALAWSNASQTFASWKLIAWQSTFPTSRPTNSPSCRRSNLSRLPVAPSSS